MSEISTSLALFEESNRALTEKSQPVRRASFAPSKSSRAEDPEGEDSLLIKFNQKSVTIQFLLFAGVFGILNTLGLPDLTLKSMEAASNQASKTLDSEKALNWSSIKGDLESFYKEIVKESDNLIIKAQHSHNPRNVEILKQVFKVFIMDHSVNHEPAEMPKLLGESFIRYLFAYTFIKQIGKHISIKAGRLDATLLSVARVYEAVNQFKKCNKKVFLIFLSKFRLNDQLQILEEIKEFMQVNY